MSNPDLTGRRILIVEDDYLLAQELSQTLRDCSAELLGPVASMNQAMALLHDGLHPDVAVLDIRLVDETVYPLADKLTELGIPFIFASSELRRDIPDRFDNIPLFSKPLDLTRATANLLGADC